MSFVDGSVKKRIRKNTFFKQMNVLIDWSLIEKENTKVYKKGKSVDASLTDSPRCPHGKPQYELSQDRQEDQRSEDQQELEKQQMKLVKKEQAGEDTEARYLKKEENFILDIKSRF